MPRYLMHKEGADSQGNVGPTMQRVQDKYKFNQEKNRILEPMVEAALPLGAYSGDAEGSILPIDPMLMLRVKALLGKGAKERDIFDELKAVKSGNNQWGKFESDAPRDLSNLFKTNPHGFKEYIGPDTMRLDQILGGRMTAPGSTPVKMRKDMAYNVRGSLNDIKKDPSISLNVGRLDRSPDDYIGTVSHENQHLFDYGIGRSHGTNLTATEPSYLKSLESMLGDKFSAEDRYLHNIGEIRARQNDMLNMRPDSYQGLDSVFNDAYPLREQMIWGK